MIDVSIISNVLLLPVGDWWALATVRGFSTALGFLAAYRSKDKYLKTGLFIFTCVQLLNTALTVERQAPPLNVLLLLQNIAISLVTYRLSIKDP